MNVWLDDIRTAPEGYTHVKTVAEAWELLTHNEVIYMSLDHDLGDHEPSGKALVMLMVEGNKWPLYKPQVHSQNPYGRLVMLDLIERYGPYDEGNKRTT